MLKGADGLSASLRGLDAVLSRVEGKVDALPTREWIRASIVREVARTTALTAAIAALAGTLALCLLL